MEAKQQYGRVEVCNLCERIGVFAALDELVFDALVLEV